MTNTELPDPVDLVARVILILEDYGVIFPFEKTDERDAMSKELEDIFDAALTAVDQNGYDVGHEDGFAEGKYAGWTAFRQAVRDLDYRG